MNKITAVKCTKINDPGSRDIRWVDPIKIDAPLCDPYAEPAPMTFTYYTGKREIFGYYPSDNRLEFVLDSTSDPKHVQDFMREIYNLAIKDIAETLCTDEAYLRGRMHDHFLQKYMNR